RAEPAGLREPPPAEALGRLHARGADRGPARGRRRRRPVRGLEGARGAGDRRGPARRPAVGRRSIPIAMNHEEKTTDDGPQTTPKASSPSVVRRPSPVVPTLGILGAGQLGRMTALAAI